MEIDRTITLVDSYVNARKMNHPMIPPKKNENSDGEKERREMRERQTRDGISYFIEVASSKCGQKNPHHSDGVQVVMKYPVKSELKD